MGIPLQLVGQRFGILLVISQVEYKKSPTYWNCSCHCGKEKIIKGSLLTNGQIKSCGCIKDRKLNLKKRKKRENARNSLYRRYKKRASRKGIDFTLTEAEFKMWTRSSCYYCRKSIKNSNTIIDSYTKEKMFPYNGIDRKDNTIGYITNNVVSCCWTCNQWKGNLSLKEFKGHILKLYNNLLS